MPYEHLLKAGRIKEYSAKKVEIQQLLKVAQRDLRASTRNLDNDPEWAFSMAYNAMLQVSRGLMMNEGYRPRGGNQHATVVEFIKERLGDEFTSQSFFFDQMRRKTNRIIYEISGLVSKREAADALALAKEFVKKIEEIINQQPGLDLNVSSDQIS